MTVTLGVEPRIVSGNTSGAAGLDVLYTSTLYPPAIGGAHNYLHRVARALAARHRVHVVTHSAEYRRDWLRLSTVAGPGPRRYEHEGVPVAQLGLSLGARLAVAPWAAAYYAAPGPAARAVARRVGGALAALAGTPDVVHAVRIGREFLTRASLDFARRRGVPFVLTPCHHPRWRGRRYAEYDRIYREADALIALTGAERDLLVEEKGVRPERVHVVGVGPLLAATGDAAGDAAGFRARHGLCGAQAGGPIVLFLGQQLAYKGVGALLDAAPGVWARHPGARVVLAGPPTRFSRARVARLGDPRVLDLGAVDLATKTAALAACDVLCLPSTQESFGIVFTEAWSFGKPVVGGRIPPIASVVDDGVDGLLSSQDPAELADRICALLDDPAGAARMGAAGARKVAARYTWEAIAAQTDAVYRAALAGVAARRVAA